DRTRRRAGRARRRCRRGRRRCAEETPSSAPAPAQGENRRRNERSGRVTGVASAAAYVGIGSNLDDPERQVRRAIEALASMPETRLVRASRLFRTAPWGRTDQPGFVNAAAEIETTLSPRALLDAL